ncbi:hypothetical protein BY996DRAFT_6425147 [Phakopsora pachyrhizi]|nr:hypothetical protein BY996DRAFT_6425147 [Phakopsora pachyrhizi]
MLVDVDFNYPSAQRLLNSVVCPLKHVTKAVMKIGRASNNQEAHDQIRGAVSAAIIKSASFESSAGDEKMVILGSDLTESSDEDGDVIAEIRRDTNTSQGYHDDKDYNENEDVEDEDNKNEQDWDEEDGDSNNNIHDKHGAHNTDFGIDLAEGIGVISFWKKQTGTVRNTHNFLE